MTPDQIKRLRKRLKMNREELALEVGVSSAAIFAWEKGERRPSGSAIILLKRLAENGAKP